MNHDYQLNNCAMINVWHFFLKTTYMFFLNWQVTLKGYHNHNDGLWDVPMKNTHDQLFTQTLQPVKNSANYTCTINYIVQKNKTKLELTQHLHACAFSPSVYTLQACIRRGNFLSYPGIEEFNFQSTLGTTMANAKGHLNQERKNYNQLRL